MKAESKEEDKREKKEIRKEKISIAPLSVTQRVALFLVIVVLLPMTLTGIGIEAGWLVPQRNIYLALPIFFLFLIMPFSRLFAHYLINRDLKAIGRFCTEIKRGNYAVSFDLPNQKEEEDPFLVLLRDLSWMSHNVERRETQSRSRYDRIRFEYTKMEQKALTDSLTGLFNRHYLEKFMMDSDVAERFDQISVLYIDCDRFKAVNDSCGHDVGDSLLVWLADSLKGACRLNHDIPLRMGGDEFMIVLPEADICMAENVANRVRSFYHGKSVYNTTLSMGIACWYKDNPEPFSLGRLSKEADEQAYAAKQAGGDEICINGVLRRQSKGQPVYNPENSLGADDALTGLPNRYRAEEWFREMMAKGEREHVKCYLMFLDLDDFKTINDSLGHVVGDRYLKYLAGSLKRILRVDDTLFRLGGDEFLIIAAEVSHEADIAALAIKVLESVKRPVLIGETPVSATASVGIAMMPEDGEDFDVLCKWADIAMFRAKARGKNNYCMFSPEMAEHVDEAMALTIDLRAAISQGQLELYYQPQISLQDDGIVGAEALIRWNHPERGVLAPDVFIHLAESSGLIQEMGDWIIEEACRQCAVWRDQLNVDLSVAINISPLQVGRGKIVSSLQTAMQRYKLRGEMIELEFTESLLMNKSTFIEQELTALRREGISFAIDDFGTGYSNLGYLKQFDFSRIKIDKSFIQEMLKNQQDQVLVTAIIQMSRSLQLGTVAEGIEDERCIELLRTLGCDCGQGYYWAKPLPGDAFLDFCRNYRNNLPDCNVSVPLQQNS